MRKLLSLCCVAVIFGCAPSAEYSSTSSELTRKVDIYHKRSEIRWDYEVMGEISGADFYADAKAIQDKLAAKAEARGADGILITSTHSEHTLQAGYIPASASYYRGNFQGTSSYNPVQKVVKAQLLKYRRY